MDDEMLISRLVLKFLILSILLISLTTCDKTGEGVDSMGVLMVRLTDAPFPVDLVDSANVTINKIEIRKAAAEDESYPFLTLSEDTYTYNLLDLRNGITVDLVEIAVPAGEYDLLRLYVAEAKIVLKDESEYQLKVPSGFQTGVKVFIEPSIRVVGGLTSELLLDFDASQSFVVQGNPTTPAEINGFHFKPVIRAVNTSVAGQIFGVVIDADTSTPIEDAEVQIEYDGSTISSFTDLDGEYLIMGVPQGIYAVTAIKDGYDTMVLEGQEVVAANKTEVNISLRASSGGSNYDFTD
jgi:hypothetical protein